MSDSQSALEQDADLGQPLKRVSYEAGMLLGLEATRDEQDYHRRRLNRHQYWFQGAGTLVGMAVSVDPESSGGSDPILTRLVVSPGVGIDGFGREVLVSERYCVDLGDWLKAQSETRLREGYDEVGNLLWLKVTVRYQGCAVDQQPVLSRKLNLSTDAVQPARTADSIALEIIPELPPADEEAYQPWAAHGTIDDTPDGPRPAALNTTENNYLDGVEGASEEAGRQLTLHSRLLHALEANNVGVELAMDQLEAGARILLARMSIAVPELSIILSADENTQVVNPNDIFLNNLVRPFVVTASQLAYLQRHTTP